MKPKVTRKRKTEKEFTTKEWIEHLCRLAETLFDTTDKLREDIDDCSKALNAGFNVNVDERLTTMRRHIESRIDELDKGHGKLNDTICDFIKAFQELKAETKEEVLSSKKLSLDIIKQHRGWIADLQEANTKLDNEIANLRRGIILTYILIALLSLLYSIALYASF